MNAVQIDQKSYEIPPREGFTSQPRPTRSIILMRALRLTHTLVNPPAHSPRPHAFSG